MITTTPQMGTANWMISDMLKRLNVEYRKPIQTTAKTINLGVRHSPEHACLPLKVTLGNFIESLEEGEVDTLIMAGGCGPCRFGYYAQVQEAILRDLGYDNFKMIVLEPPLKHPINFYKTIKGALPKHSIRSVWEAYNTSLFKANALDVVEAELSSKSCYELTPGETEKAYNKATRLINQAFTKEEISEAERVGLSLIKDVPKEEREVLKIGFVGEFYMLLERAVNYGIEKWLGQRGVEVTRPLYGSSWLNRSKASKLSVLTHDEIRHHAYPYLSHTVGGEGINTVGYTAYFAKQNYDAVIHLMPFTCMPETVAKSFFPEIQRDFDMPILSFVIDEHSGRAGVMTRLEALIDLCWAKRAKRQL